MEIQEILKQNKPRINPKINSERADIVYQFLQEINKERIGTKYPPAAAKWVAVVLSPIKTNEGLYEFLSICKDYRNRNGSFGKRFFTKQNFNG